MDVSRILQFITVVLLCTVIGVLCERFAVDTYLKWLLMALPAIIWARLRLRP